MVSAALVVLTTLVVSLATADVFVQRGKQRKSPVFRPSDRKPNIVLILTDDQDVELGSLNFMPNTLELLGNRGAQFMHAYVTTPMCCPSRSSLLTGMYVHNHHVYTNNDNCSSSQWQAMYETKSFATYLSNAGYRTGYFGKYLNKYNGSYVPPGWREWGGLIMNSKYYNYSINMNGKKIKHGFDYHKDYYPDLIANDSIAFLRQSKKNSAHKPVMLTMSFPAPHGPEDSAPQYSHMFFNVSTHHTPSYDYAPNPDKQWILQVTQKMQPIHKQFTDLLMTKRLQTLQSVDAAVKLVVDELKTLGELDNTYIIYTSDHGYHLGQFGLIKGKSFPFEFDVRIPFLVRGPGVEPGTVVDDIVLNIDLAPTFLDIAGVDAPPHMDGRSVLPLFHNTKRKRVKWPDTFLIESSGRRETPYLDAKTKFKFVRRNGTESPLSTAGPGGVSTVKPPVEFTTLGGVTPRVYDSGEDLMIDEEDEDEEIDDDDIDGGYEDDAYVDSNEANVTNNEPLGRLPTANKLERLSLECALEEMQLPCSLHQKWYCINDSGRWRKHKCKSLTPPESSKSFRKCACFTEAGLVYKRIRLGNKTRRHARLKRDADLADIFTKIRAKRDVLEHVETVMQDVQGQIYNLKSVNTSLLEEQPNLATNTISQSAGCVIMERGQVNCSNVIYHNRKSWRESRHQIDNEIYQLKQKLEKLKEIRRHLKHTKPISSDVEDEYKNKTGRLESSEVNELNVELGAEQVNVTRVKKKRKRVEVTTNAPIGKHRHHRRFYGSTRGSQSEFTTVGPRRTSTEAAATTMSVPTTEDALPHLDPFCHCEPTAPIKPTERDRFKEAKLKQKEEKLRRKLRKQRKKDQLEKECASERMNCFHHDKEHWKTAPLWTAGPFCFCMNANNNTYSCVRTINSTHNFLYCEFTTGLVTFYNLRMDPFELQNRAEQLKPDEKAFLHNQLKHLVACKGKSCTVNHNVHAHHSNTKIRANSLPVQTGGQQTRYKKRKSVGEYEGGGGTGSTGARTGTKNRNNTAMMKILRQAGIRGLQRNK